MGDILLVVASGSFSFTLTQTLSVTGFESGNVSGTLTVTGNSLGGGAAMTFSELIVGTYIEEQ
ncbi:MAG TPA: hypothetical protein VIY49_37585 [Bryobacteraceae bacterium]